MCKESGDSMKFKQDFKLKYFGPEVELQYRMFCICSMLGTITSFFGAVLCFVIAGIKEPVTYITGVGFLFMLVMTIYGYESKKYVGVVTIMSSVLNLVVFPFTFLTTGALYSVAPMFFILGIFIAAPILKGKHRLILFVVQLVYYSGVISLCYFFGDLSFVRPHYIHATMLLFSFIIVSLYIFSATMLITKQYDHERERAEELNRILKTQAHHDPLTGLYNRRYLINVLQEKVDEKGDGFSIVLMDIDDFKKINDQYGHLIGDEVLIAFSDLLIEHFDKPDFASRYGGEEFMAFFNYGNIEEIENTINEVKESLALVCKKKLDMPVTFSAGIATYKGGSLSGLINKADQRLYKAKKTGKNKIVTD